MHVSVSKKHFKVYLLIYANKNKKSFSEIDVCEIHFNRLSYQYYQ